MARPTLKAKLKALTSLDGRTRAYREAVVQRDRLIADRGGPDVISAGQYALAEAASALSAMRKDMTAAWAMGENVNQTLFCTVCNTERANLIALGLERQARDITPSIQSYLANRAEGGDG